MSLPTMTTVGSILAFIMCAGLGSASAFGFPKKSPLKVRHVAFTTTRRQPGNNRQTHTARSLFGRTRFEKFVDGIFDQADTNKDGSVDFAETYEMVLRMYVQLNQQAPVPPPPRKKVYQIFRESDKDRNKRVSREEFATLARILGRRAIARLVAYKVVTLIGAPLLAEFTLRELMGREWLHKVAGRFVPGRFSEALTSVTFWRTALIVVFVASLGNIVLSLVNFVLDLNARAQQENVN